MKKISAIIFGLLMTATSFACGGESKMPEYTDDKVMEIGAFSAPDPTRESYETLAASGINHIYLNDRGGAIKGNDAYFQVLEWCEEFGIKAIVFMNNYPGNVDSYQIDNDEFKKYSAFSGFNFYDEPTSQHFDLIKDYIQPFETYYPDHTFFVNLFPSYAPVSALGFDSYEEYVESFCKDILSKLKGKKQLSVDYYPLMTRGGEPYLKEGWLRNLEITAELGKQYDAEVHYFIQSTDFGSERRAPTEADFRFQSYVCMAYGVRALSHFNYQSGEGGEFRPGQTGLIDTSGNKTERYEAASAVNHELLAFDHVYLSFEYLETMPVVGKNTVSTNNNFYNLMNPAESLEGISAAEAEEDALIGSFRDGDGNLGYLAVNFTDPAQELSNRVSLNIKNKKKALVYRGGVRSVVNLKDGVLDLNLASGEGVFVIPF